jgi:DNA primase
VLSLPPGTDPDEVIRRDPEEWRRLTEKAKPVVDHLFEAMATRLKGVSSPMERSRAAMELVPVLEGLTDPVTQATYVQRLARALELDLAGEETELRALRRRGRHTTAKTEEPGAEPLMRQVPREPREEYLLTLLFLYPTLRARGAALSSDLFSLTENRELFEAWQAVPPGEPEEVAEAVRPLVPDELRGNLESVLTHKIPPFQPAEAEKALEDCIWRIEQRKLELGKLASSQALAKSEQEVGAARLLELARSVQEGALSPSQEADLALDAASVLAEDTEAGIRVHRRPLERARKKTKGQPVQEG